MWFRNPSDQRAFLTEHARRKRNDIRERYHAGVPPWYIGHSLGIVGPDWKLQVAGLIRRTHHEPIWSVRHRILIPGRNNAKPKSVSVFTRYVDLVQRK